MKESKMNLPVYKCTKEVRAFKIHRIARHVSDGSARLESECFNHRAQVGADYMIKHAPHEGGYYVLYQDGYESFSPAKAFEEGYVECAHLNRLAKVEWSNLHQHAEDENYFWVDTETPFGSYAIATNIFTEKGKYVIFHRGNRKTNIVIETIEEGKEWVENDLSLKIKEVMKFINKDQSKMSEPKAEYKTKAKETFKDRLIKEEIELKERVENLVPFIQSEKFKELDPQDARFLLIQLSLMTAYHQVLIARLENILSIEELKDWAKRDSNQL